MMPNQQCHSTEGNCLLHKFCCFRTCMHFWVFLSCVSHLWSVECRWMAALCPCCWEGKRRSGIALHHQLYHCMLVICGIICRWMAALCPASNSKCQWHGASRRWKPLQCLPTQPPPIIPVHPGHPSVRIVLGPNLQDILRLSYYPNPEWWGAGVVVSLERGADLHMAQLMPLPLTVSCFSKIQIGFTFLVSAHPGSPGKGQLNRCVCVSYYPNPNPEWWGAGVVVCLEWGADLVQGAGTFWYRLLSSPGQRAVKWVCMCILWQCHS